MLAGEAQRATCGSASTPRRDHDDVDDEPVIYRREVLTIMWLIGDLTFAVLLALAEGTDGSEEDDED